MALFECLSAWRLRRRLDAQRRILSALAAAGDWCFGLDLMRTCRLRSGRFYPTLSRLEASKLVEAKWDDNPNGPEDTTRRRRMYRLNEEPF